MKQDVEKAAAAMREIFPPTPLQLNEHLSARCGATVFLKREDLSPVRSYKIRGAFNFFRKSLGSGAAGKTFVCASRAITLRALLSSAATSAFPESSSCP